MTNPLFESLLNLNIWVRKRTLKFYRKDCMAIKNNSLIHLKDWSFEIVSKDFYSLLYHAGLELWSSIMLCDSAGGAEEKRKNKAQGE